MTNMRADPMKVCRSRQTSGPALRKPEVWRLRLERPLSCGPTLHKLSLLLCTRFLLFAGLVAIAGAALAADSPDARFLEGLRQRRLFTLAETYCLDRLDDEKLADAQRAELVVEASRTYLEHALHTPPGPAADALWQQASQAPLDFARQHAGSPRLLLVKTQSALVVMARGELARQQSEVTTDNEKSLGQARALLRTASRQLVDLGDELAVRLRETIRPTENEPFSRDQLLALARNLRYQHAKALRNLGQSYPADSPDRTSALAQAADALEPLVQLDDTDPLAWQSRLDDLICQRLLKDFPAAQRRLGQILRADPPPAVVLRARAEQIRLLLAAGQIDEALAIVESGREPGGIKQPEFNLACLEAYLAAWRAAGDAKRAADAKRWEGVASTALAEIARSHGSYWVRRAESLWAGRFSAGLPSSEMDLLVRAAERHYRNGQLDQAIKAYDQAAKHVVEQGHDSAAFQFSFTAAAIEQERKSHGAARERYRQLAHRHPKHERAAEAHHLAIFNAAQEAKRSGTASLAEYGTLLEEHLRLWPTGHSADQAQWLLGRLREHQNDWPAAVAAYRSISPEHPQFVPGLKALAGCYDRWLSELQDERRPTREVAAAASEYFEGLLRAERGLPQNWGMIEHTAALAAARLWLRESPPRYERIEAVLAAALQDTNPAGKHFAAEELGLLVLALAGQGRHEAAQQKLGELTGEAPGALLDLLEQLSRLLPVASQDDRRALLSLKILVIDRLKPRQSELEADKRMVFDHHAARAYAAAGQTSAARQLYQRLIEQNPRDGDLQEEYALVLSQGTDKASLDAALGTWRQVEQKSKPGSPRWFRAKYNLAHTHERLGNKQHASKIVALTQVLHPELGGPELKARFEELLARCQK